MEAAQPVKKEAKKQVSKKDQKAKEMEEMDALFAEMGIDTAADQKEGKSKKKKNKKKKKGDQAESAKEDQKEEEKAPVDVPVEAEDKEKAILEGQKKR